MNDQNYNEQYDAQGVYYAQQTTPVEAPTGKGIAAMIMGILSIYMGYIPGIVLAILAGKFAAPILYEFPGTKAANFANVGRITGQVGLIVSIISALIIGFILMFYVIIYAIYIIFLFIYIFYIFLLVALMM